MDIPPSDKLPVIVLYQTVLYYAGSCGDDTRLRLTAR